jgi:hypothetical protein
LVLVLGLPVAAAEEGKDTPGKPGEQFQALRKEYHRARADLAKAKTDGERKKLIERRNQVAPKILALAQRYPKEPLAVDALFDMVWFGMPGRDKALALLQRDHARSARLGQVRTQTAFGSPQDVTIMQQVASFFSKEGESFLRTVLERNPHRAVQGQACLALAQFQVNRLHRLALLKERPDLAGQYEKLFGKAFLEDLQRNRAKAAKEAEALFERAAAKYGDVKLPSGGTVGDKAKTGLFGIRDLTVGKAAPDIEGKDQDGKQFKLSDYRGKVVLLYFWHQQ